MSKEEKITKEMTIREVIIDYPAVLETLSENLNGQCFGCPMAQIETLAQAAKHHGVDKDKLINQLNSKIKSHQSRLGSRSEAENAK